MKSKEQTIADMAGVIFNKDNTFNQMIIGKRTISEEFEDKQYIPTTIRNLVNEKVQSDYETITKALKLLEFYKSAGVESFDYQLNNIVNNLIVR